MEKRNNKKTKAPKRRKATAKQVQAAKTRIPRRDWVKDIASFRKAKQNNVAFDMGSPGSAQVTRVRLIDWDGFKGLTCFTRGATLYVTKLSREECIAAVKKAGKW